MAATCTGRRLATAIKVAPIIFTEICERFAFYSCRAILVFYLMDKLGFSEPAATSAYSYFMAACYFSPLLGGYLADIWGKFKVITIFNVVYIGGVSILAGTAYQENPNLAGAVIGLLLMALGTGGIKPCISPFGAEQLDGADPVTMTTYFMTFYASINCGSVFSYLITPIIKQRSGYGPAFTLAAAFVTLSVIVFTAPYRQYRRVPPSGTSVWASVGTVIRASLGLAPAGRARVNSQVSHSEGVPLIGATVAAVDGGSQSGERAEDSQPATGDVASTPAPAGDDLTTSVDAKRLAVASAASQAGAAASQDVEASHVAIADGADDDDAPGGATATRREGRAQLLRTDAASPGAPDCLARAARSAPPEDVDGVRAVLRVLPLFLLLPVFWALFDSQGSIWSIQRKHMNNCIGPDNSDSRVCLTPEQLGAMNPLLILLFAPLLDRVVFPLLRTHAPRWAQPTPLRRMTLGMLTAAGAFGFTYMVQRMIDTSEDGTTPVLWQLPQFFVISFSEILISATGLEWSYSQSPARMRGTIMALYQAMTGVGNILTAVVYESLSGVLSPAQLILLLAGMMIVAGCIFAVLAWRYKPVPAVHTK